MGVKIDGSTYKANGFAKELEDELMNYTEKHEDSKVNSQLVEKNREVQKMNSTDIEPKVNILECKKSLENGPILAAEYQDTTESSSSFDGSDCDVDNSENLNSESEALSDFRASAFDFDGFGENVRMRKKKLTTHWRSYIQPLMWRCKWIELQIKKLQSQGQRYDRELEAYNNGKQIIQLENSPQVDCAKSVPFSSRISAANEVLKRKKRKRNEATIDVAAYMSRHNIFSYYENKKPSPDGAVPFNDVKNPAAEKVNIDDEFWVNEDLLSSFEPREGDNSLEQTLRKVDFLQSKVGNLKNRAEKIMRENAGKFSSFDDLSLAMTYSTSSAYSGEASGVGNYFASQLLAEYITVPQSEVTTQGDAYKNVEDGALIDNRRVKEEMDNFDDVMIRVNTAPQIRAEAELPVNEQTPPKTRSVGKVAVPKGKRKRGRRKGVGRPSRRTTG